MSLHSTQAWRHSQGALPLHRRTRLAAAALPPKPEAGLLQPTQQQAPPAALHRWRCHQPLPSLAPPTCLTALRPCRRLQDVASATMPLVLTRMPLSECQLPLLPLRTPLSPAALLAGSSLAACVYRPAHTPTCCQLLKHLILRAVSLAAPKSTAAHQGVCSMWLQPALRCHVARAASATAVTLLQPMPAAAQQRLGRRRWPVASVAARLLFLGGRRPEQAAWRTQILPFWHH